MGEMHNFKCDILHILQIFCVLFLPSFLLSHAKKPSGAGTKKKKRSNDFCCEIVGPLGPSGENRTHGLLNPIVLLSKTQWTLRYHLYAVSSNFKIILSFCFVRCQDVSFLLWSNCGQPTLTNDHSPLLSYMAQFRFSKIEIALFCLHELFIRRICQPCQ